MVSATTSRWTPLERWGPTLLLTGGGLLAVHAAMVGVQAFSELTTPPDVFGPAGHLVALAGLLGLYPALAGRKPAWARAAGAVTAVALAGWTVMTVARSLAVVGVVPSSDVLPGVFLLLLFGSTVLAYALFGVATVRAGGQSRAVGLLVLAPAALLVVVLAASAVTGVSDPAAFVVAGGLALSMVALGYTLRTWEAPTDRAAPASDPATG